MLAEIGLLATFFAFIAAIYAIPASVYGERRHNESIVLSGRNAALLTFPLLLVATGALQIALMTEQYQISYIWSVSSPSMTDFFRFTALWGSQQGSLLFWCFLMSAFSFAAIALNWRSQRRLMPYAIAYMMVVLVFFVGLVLFLENPFERYWIVDSEVVQTAFIPAGAVAPAASRLAETANGLNPLLRHFGMAIHPPMLYLGFVGFVIPFAFAMAALASGDLSTNWIKATRFWALIAWLFLSLGLILGGRWAYDVLGWGGYWGWDPVENAAFLPWLMGTAFLHSVIIQEKRGMLKMWNMFLVNGTFSAVIFGTFATRSGLVDSVHSFARSEVGFPMFTFWFLVTMVSMGLLLWRYNRGELKDDHPFTNILSRESLFILNNFIFLALFVAIFWGSFGAPIVSELFMNTNITLGTDYFMQVTPPLFAALYILMGIAPLSAWNATSARRLGQALYVPIIMTVVFLAALAVFFSEAVDPLSLFGYGIVALAGAVAIYETYRGARARRSRFSENWLQAFMTLIRRNPRRYGGYMVHLGITVIGLGVIGSTLFQVETQQTLTVGQSLEIDNYTLHFDRLNSGQVADDGRIMDIAEMTVMRDGETVAQLRPRRDRFPEGEGINTMTIAGAHSTIRNDFYVLLVGWEPIGAGQATFKVYVNPLVNLVWWGGLILIVGTFMAVWPWQTATSKVKSEQPTAVARGVA